MIDVTAVAYCYDGKGRTQPWGSLSKKLLPYDQRLPLLKGNIVNLFLDVLINQPDTDFRALTKMIFQTQPLALCAFGDAEIKKLIEELKAHYLVLKQWVLHGLGEVEITREDCQLEPSFYSPTYGLQGRLDLLHYGEDEKGPKTSIVELKSGKVFAPNRHGLNQGHFIQTLLYDLMVKAAFGRQANVAAYILYSSTQERSLRFAPAERFQQQEALGIRNQLLAIDWLLCRIGAKPGNDILEQVNRLIQRFLPSNFTKLSPFVEQDFTRVLKNYQQLGELERRYFGAFLGFTAREHRLAKTGEQGTEKLNGLAGLWLDESAEKLASFDLLAGLSFKQYDPQTGIVHFLRPKDAEQMAKFRIGDIVVLYAVIDTVPERAEVLRGQVLKSTIIELNAESIQVRLRSHQLNDRMFQNRTFWCVERDVLDSSFNNHYRGLWSWVESPPAVRATWLGTIPPRQPVQSKALTVAGMTEEQQRILAKILVAPDYFLLWGPPGTGKTSIMLHHLVGYLLHHTNENILLVAYTNRAVDEICESIERLQDGQFRNYLRIGSRYGTSPRFRDRLLSIQSENFVSRSGLLDLIERTRIFVGTVAGVGGKEELFKLKQFDRIVVDEASQI
ncbi:MAG: AAA domain-containing protein, partial [Bacteroidota bacterium]